MLTKFKTMLLILFCLVVAGQLAGCIFVRHDRRGDNRHEGHHEMAPVSADLNVRVH